MTDRLSHSELCDLLARLMEFRVLAETQPLSGPIESSRKWKHILAFIDRLAEERGNSRVAMLAHFVCLGLAVDASTAETVSHLIDKL